MTDNGVETEVLFQMADVSCPLMSVSAICDHGNRFIFGRAGGVVQNVATGMEVPFERCGGVYAMGLWVRRGNEEAAKASAGSATGSRAAGSGPAKASAFVRR